jgi:hypothetical protein
VPYRPFKSQSLTTRPESITSENTGISRGQRKLEETKFAGLTGKYLRTRLSKKDFHTLDGVRQQAIRLYWKAVLKAEDLSMRVGSNIGAEDIVYGQDIRVLDFFATAKKYDLRPDGEILDSED